PENACMKSDRPPLGITVSAIDNTIDPAPLRQLADTGIAALVDSHGNQVPLHPAVADAVAALLLAAADNKVITVVNADHALTTQQAANLLGMSRQFLVELLEKGEIPFHKVGTHRRIRATDLEHYAIERSERRRRILAESTRAIVEAGLYDRVLAPEPR
ncbi:MAG: helix-turn-helix domain-containing protein, partial [Armatimonadaceae bacterium]